MKIGLLTFCIIVSVFVVVLGAWGYSIFDYSQQDHHSIVTTVLAKSVSNSTPAIITTSGTFEIYSPSLSKNDAFKMVDYIPLNTPIKLHLVGKYIESYEYIGEVK